GSHRRLSGSSGYRFFCEECQININSMDYSRIEFAADARHRVCSCGSPLQMPCNEADAVKSARPKGKLGRHIIKRNAFETN
ncbi:MAG: hypothetical protein V3T59_01730, partial [Desulfobacterales bacterium]